MPVPERPEGDKEREREGTPAAAAVALAAARAAEEEGIAAAQVVEAQLLRAALCQEATELGQMVQEVCRDIRGTSVLAEPGSVAASPHRTALEAALAAEEEERAGGGGWATRPWWDALWKINTYRRSLALLSVTWGCRLHDPALFPQLHRPEDQPSALPSAQGSVVGSVPGSPTKGGEDADTSQSVDVRTLIAEQDALPVGTALGGATSMQEAEAIAAIEAIAAADMAQAALLPSDGTPQLAPMEAMALLPATVARLTGEMPVEAPVPAAGSDPSAGSPRKPAGEPLLGTVPEAPPPPHPLQRSTTAPAALLKELVREERRRAAVDLAMQEEKGAEEAGGEAAGIEPGTAEGKQAAGKGDAPTTGNEEAGVLSETGMGEDKETSVASSRRAVASVPTPITMPLWGRIMQAASTTDTMLRFLNQPRYWRRAKERAAASDVAEEAEVSSRSESGGEEEQSDEEEDEEEETGDDSESVGGVGNNYNSSPPPTRSLAPTISGPPTIRTSIRDARSLSFKVDLANLRSNLSKGRGGALSPTPISPENTAESPLARVPAGASAGLWGHQEPPPSSHLLSRRLSRREQQQWWKQSCSEAGAL
eukprot:jgi/Botrbrau1/13696/Bobra.0261s0006.1